MTCELVPTPDHECTRDKKNKMTCELVPTPDHECTRDNEESWTLDTISRGRDRVTWREQRGSKVQGKDGRAHVWIARGVS